MIEFIVAVDARPNTKSRHFVSVAQALDRGLVRSCCHTRKRDRFSAHRKPQKALERLGLLRHVAQPFTHFFPRRATIIGPGAAERAQSETTKRNPDLARQTSMACAPSASRGYTEPEHCQNK